MASDSGAQRRWVVDPRLPTTEGTRSAGIGWTLVYTKIPCTESDFDALFSLHVWPKDAADLPPHRAAHGYENLDFSCTADLCWRDDEQCVATAYVPDYPIGRMYTGQYRVVDESIRPSGPPQSSPCRRTPEPPSSVRKSKTPALHFVGEDQRAGVVLLDGGSAEAFAT